MPRKDLPSHELLDKKESKQNYDDLKEEFKKKQIENSIPIDKVKLVSDKNLADNLIQQLGKKLLGIGDQLVKDAMVTFNATDGLYPGAIDTIAQWKTKSRLYNCDLSGFWNDLKLEKADLTSLSVLKQKFPDLTDHASSQTRLGKLMDLLELAEQNGGLTDWLERFLAELASASPQWNKLATIAECIQKGIDFNKAVIDTIRKETGAEFDISARQVCTELSFALSAIAQEIGMQIKRHQSGLTIDINSPIEAAKARLKEHSYSDHLTDRIRQDLSAGTFKDTWTDYLKEAAIDTSDGKKITTALDSFTIADKHVADLVKKISHSTNVDNATQESKTGDLTKAAKDIATSLRSSISHIDWQNKPFEIKDELTLFTRLIMGELVVRLDSYKQQITSPVARKDILDTIRINDVRGSGFLGEIGINYNYYDPNSAYLLAKDYFTNASLGTKLWKKDIQIIIDYLRNVKNPGYDTSVADQLEKLDSAYFIKLLDKWKPDLPQDKSYGLIWDTLNSLRSFKTQTAAILSADAHQKEKRFLARELDAITVQIAEKLKGFK